MTGVCEEQKELPEKDITLTHRVEPGVRMRADATLIARMLTNLIRNAYRYGREGGHIEVSLSKNEDRIRLAVADDGIGIEKEDLSKIFNRFYRADKSRTYAEGSGLGLGLSMVREIAALHKGEVSVTSAPGEGSTFTVVF